MPNDTPASETHPFVALGVSGPLCRGLTALAVRTPRPIQAEAVPRLRDGRDVIGLAPTGTGKTIAFLLPLLERIRSERDAMRAPRGRGRRQSGAAPVLRGLVLCPTRELTQQVAGVAERLGREVGLRTVCAYGKVGLAPQLAAIEAGVDLLVATPGRVRELREDHGLDLGSISFVVVDEADRMLDLGFLPQVATILEAVPGGRQIGMFTATMPAPVEELAARFLVDPIRIEVGTHTRAAAHLEQELVRVEDRDKLELLVKRLRDESIATGALVFCRTKRRVGWVGAALARHEIKVGMLHGDRSQAQRRRALDRFEAGEIDVLVCTDVAARGLHLERVKTVVNYDVPREPEEFVHRVGRAGHGGTAGRSVTFLSGPDRALWRDVARVTEVGLGAVPGLERTEDAQRAADAREKRAKKADADDRYPPKRYREGKRMAGARGKRRKPIDKDEKPGTGVIRLKKPGDAGEGPAGE